MLRVGIIGCGNIFTMHATSAHFLPNATIVGVCDIKKDRADKAAEKYNTKAYYDYEEMIEKEKPDVVHVCLPHYLHPVATKYALEHGVHVLCEKPMSIKMEDALENVALAKKMNLRYGIIFQCRYNDASMFVKKRLDNGSLGKIISARVVLTWTRSDDYYSKSDWKGTWDKEGGGVVIDQAIHSLDLANWFIGDEVESLQSQLSNRGHQIMDVDDTAEGFIRYKNGATLSFWAMNNYGCDEPIEIRLFCEKGKAVLSYDDATVYYNDGKVENVKQGEAELRYENGKDYWGFQHVRQIDNFYKSVEQGIDPEISGEEALKIQKIICEIYAKGNFYKNN